MKITTMALAVLTGIALLFPLVQAAAAPLMVDHHRPGHGSGGSTEGGSASIQLIQCDGDSGGAAKWKKSTVKYAIDNISGSSQDVIAAVEKGVLEWNTVMNGSPYILQKAGAAETADITIKIYFKLTPGYILGASFVTCPDEATGIVPHEILLGVKGLALKGVQNLAAHEVGHSLGLGHADKNADLMGPSLDSTERKNLTCPSNLDLKGLTEAGTSASVDNWQLLSC